MSSLFRSPGSGGKLLHRRSRTPPASPYARPPGMSSPPAAQSRGSPRWLARLISGAGKLISSVLPSKRSVSSSSGEEEEEESSSEFDEEEEHCGLSQGRKESDLANKHMTGPLAIVPQSESKLLIEKLLMQETFSRDECDRLTKLIQSRVLDFPSPEVCGEETMELRNRTPGNDIPLFATSPFGQKRRFAERVSYSSRKPNLYSPKSSAFEACTPPPDIYNKAIVEAKKWLEERKLVSKPKYDRECGPCTLNTDMLNHEIEDVGGSPVDMAKSYMRSLPPWRSPSFSGVGFITPPPSRMLHYNDGIFHETANNSLSSSKVSKRGHVVFGSLDTLDETRRVRLRSADISKSKQIDTSAGGSEYESPKCLLNADKKGLYAGNHYSNITFGLPDKKEDDANHPSKTVDVKSSNGVSEPEKVGCAATVENSVSEAHPPEPIKCLDENQSSWIMEEADEVLVPNDTLASASKIVEPNGILSSETDVPPKQNIESVVPSDVDADLSDVPTSEKQTSTGVDGAILADDSSQLNPVSSVAVTNCKSDSRLEDGNSHIAKNANGSINETSTDGSSAEVNADANHETLNRETDKIVPQNGNGTRMKAIERMLSEPQRTTNRHGRKVAVKSRRGRKS